MIYYFRFKGNLQRQLLWSIALSGLVIAGAVPTIPQPSAIASSLDASPSIAQIEQSPSATRLPQRVVRRVRRDLVQRFQVSRRDLRVVDFSQETWSDSCLGLAADNERCAMAMVEGWRIQITDGQQTWVYRTDRNAQVIKLETEDTASLPAPLVDQLFATIARQANVPANTLRVIESQPRTWDGCMGIYEPGQMCTMIAMSGYRVIVMGNSQSWVYHLNQDGSMIVQNPTASGSGTQITPSFVPTEGQPPLPPEEVVFRMTISGSMDGRVTETTLTSDGTLYRRSTGMLAAEVVEPTVIKRLSQRELQQFQRLLEQQKFPNLDGMRYLTDAALADYPTTVLQAMGSTVAYIDLEQAHLPQSLQTVIAAWNRLE